MDNACIIQKAQDFSKDLLESGSPFSFRISIWNGICFSLSSSGSQKPMSRNAPTREVKKKTPSMRRRDQRRWEDHQHKKSLNLQTPEPEPMVTDSETLPPRTGITPPESVSQPQGTGSSQPPEFPESQSQPLDLTPRNGTQKEVSGSQSQPPRTETKPAVPGSYSQPPRTGTKLAVPGSHSQPTRTETKSSASASQYQPPATSPSPTEEQSSSFTTVENQRKKKKIKEAVPKQKDLPPAISPLNSPIKSDAEEISGKEEIRLLFCAPDQAAASKLAQKYSQAKYIGPHQSNKRYHFYFSAYFDSLKLPSYKEAIMASSSEDFLQFGVVSEKTIYEPKHLLHCHRCRSHHLKK